VKSTDLKSDATRNKDMIGVYQRDIKRHQPDCFLTEKYQHMETKWLISAATLSACK
jgi:hypothetical protein